MLLEALAAHRFDEGEDLVDDGGLAAGNIAVLNEVAPPQILLAGVKDVFRRGGIPQLPALINLDLALVEVLDKEQVGELLDNGDWVGNAAGPEGVPDAVNVVFEGAGNHVIKRNCRGDPCWLLARGREYLLLCPTQVLILNLLHHRRLELHRAETINPAINVVIFLAGAGVEVQADAAHLGASF